MSGITVTKSETYHVRIDGMGHTMTEDELRELRDAASRALGDGPDVVAELRGELARQEERALNAEAEIIRRDREARQFPNVVRADEHGAVVRERDEARAELERLRAAQVPFDREAWARSLVRMVAEDGAYVVTVAGKPVLGCQSFIFATNAGVEEAILATLAPPPQAAPPKLDDTLEGHVVLSLSHLLKDGDDKTAKQLVSMAAETLSRPVPPVGVGDVWGDAVRVERDGEYLVMIGSVVVDRYTSGGYANGVADDIRRGLASLPPLRAVLPDGVTDAMLDAHAKAWETTYLEREADRAAITAAIAAANIRVLGPGEGVVRVRVARDVNFGREMIRGKIMFNGRGSEGRWAQAGLDETDCHLLAGTRYILAADLDAIAGRVGT